jgi:hypothetical protein
MTATATKKRQPRSARGLTFVTVRFSAADLAAIDAIAGGADAFRSRWVTDAVVAVAESVAESADTSGWRSMGLARDLLASIAGEDLETFPVTIRFAPDELAAVEAAVKRAKMPRASWVAEAALSRARKAETRAAAKLVALATKMMEESS